MNNSVEVYSVFHRSDSGSRLFQLFDQYICRDWNVFVCDSRAHIIGEYGIKWCSRVPIEGDKSCTLISRKWWTTHVNITKFNLCPVGPLRRNDDCLVSSLYHSTSDFVDRLDADRLQSTELLSFLSLKRHSPVRNIAECTQSGYYFGVSLPGSEIRRKHWLCHHLTDFLPLIYQQWQRNGRK